VSEVDYNPGPDGVGRKPGNEIVLYRWPGYEMARVITTEQLAHLIRQTHIESDLTIGEMDIVDDGGAFILRRTEGETGEREVALILLENLGASVRSHRWIQPSIPKTGRERFSIYSIYTPRWVLTPRQISYIATFFFDWLGLDPQWMQENPRLILETPYATVLPDTDRYNHEIEHAEMLVGTPLFQDWIEEFLTTWGRGLSGQLSRAISSSAYRSATVTNRFVKMELRWEIQSGKRTERSSPSMREVRGWIVWNASWLPRMVPQKIGHTSRSAWCHTPSEAVALVEIFSDIEGLETWLDAHYQTGDPVIPDDAMETFELLDEDSPPLWPADKMLAYLRAMDVKMPWES